MRKTNEKIFHNFLENVDKNMGQFADIPIEKLATGTCIVLTVMATFVGKLEVIVTYDESTGERIYNLYMEDAKEKQSTWIRYLTENQKQDTVLRDGKETDLEYPIGFANHIFANASLLIVEKQIGV
jgi:hypothetical protein